MAGENTQPDAASNAAIDVTAITKSVTEAVTKTILETLQPKLGAIDELAKNQKVLADTIAAIPPAKADAKKEDGGDAKKEADAPAALTAEAVAKLVADGIAADRKAQAEEAAKKGERQKLVEKLTQEKLGGDATLAESLVGDDEASLTASAEKLATSVKKYKPDFGGVAKNGGDTVQQTPTAAAQLGNLSEGAARFAKGLKLPA